MAASSTTPSARLVDIDPALLQTLPGADYADAYRITLSEEQSRLSAGDLAQQMFSRKPQWVSLLLSMRARIAARLGLKQVSDGKKIPPASTTQIAGFPVVEQSDEQVQLGFNDKHLDFRIWIRRDMATTERPAQLTLTTVVRTNQLLGRVYLGVVKPFHRCIVPSVLNGLRRTTASP